MKAFFRRLACGLLATLTLFSCVACGTGDDSSAKTYTIQYTDDQGTHQFEVTSGMPYSMTTVPEKTGYEFLGLFDAENGGMKYVGASGASLSPFTDKKNLVLFPQFRAKTYTVVLDYQGAEALGSRQVEVEYDTQLPSLPKNLKLEHKKFTGWYTEENCGGVQVADRYNVIPVVSVLNETNFTISATNNYIYLYAGFETEKFTVTFHFGDGMPTEEIEVPYNTPIADVVPETRNADDFAVLSWGKTADGDQLFTGKVTEDIELYAKEWAPCINLDNNGGESVSAIVAREGATVALPTPTKSLAKFRYWEKVDGTQADITTMPASSMTLKAVWQGKLVFDENGGTEVDDISQPANETVDLPTPEKEDYIFAGWYTKDKEQYTSTKMPVEGVALKAGWYMAKNEKIVVVKESSSADDWAHSGKCGNETKGPKADWRKKIDLSAYIPATGARIKVTGHYKMKKDKPSTTSYGGFYFYDSDLVSEAYLVAKYTDRVISNSGFTQYTFTTPMDLDNNILYMCYYVKITNWDYKDGDTYYEKVYFTDIWFDVEYPDTSYLYL